MQVTFYIKVQYQILLLL